MYPRVCIVDGGPAGMMLGFLLARAGIAVTVLEKHADFLRDFRGDTLHPSTLEVMGELGLLEALLSRPHDEVRHLSGMFGDTEIPNRVGEIADWDQVKLLTVSIDRLEEWARPGLLCIGDAAHAMSPVGGVGINLAVQDAVATANILAAPLRDGPVPLELLRRVERRRWFPTVATQQAQIFLHKHAVEPILRSTGPIKIPLPLRWLKRYPVLRRIPARLVGVGVRPEHVHSPAVRSV